MAGRTIMAVDGRVSDLLQTVCQMAQDRLDDESMSKFEGWDPDDVVDSVAALKEIKETFGIQTLSRG